MPPVLLLSILSLYHHGLIDSILMDNHEVIETNMGELGFIVLPWQYDEVNPGVHVYPQGISH